jgi:hypothetical protein
MRHHADGIAMRDAWEVGSLIGRGCLQGLALASLRLKTGRQAETEAASIRYVAEMQGADMGSERTIRWLIALMVLCCDPLAIALTAAAPIRGSTTL